MKALITGASSGIGLEMAKILSKQGHDLILVSRDKEKLQQVKEKLKTSIKIIAVDLSNETKIKELYILLKNENIDILINNAGYGDCGNFCETDLNKELNMIDLNIKAVHMLTKLFLKDMRKKNNGYILNVASMAAFMPGPLMATYYSTKSYVLKLTESIYEEIKRDKVNVSISCLCPGPIKTNFLETANVKFSTKEYDSHEIAQYAIDQMFRKKLIIIPGAKMKLIRFFTCVVPSRLVGSAVYNFQKPKNKKSTK